jgi:hypothetical protein
MSNALLSIHRPKFILAPLIFGAIYTIGIPAFIFLSVGKQYIPGFAGFEQYGLIYVALCLMGAISSFAIERGHRWGIIGQLGVWEATTATNIVLHRDIETYLVLALILVVFWAFDVYRNRWLLN